MADQDHLPQAQLLPPLCQCVQEEVLRLLPRFGREPRPTCSRLAASLWRSTLVQGCMSLFVVHLLPMPRQASRLHVLVCCSYFAKVTPGIKLACPCSLLVLCHGHARLGCKLHSKPPGGTDAVETVLGSCSASVLSPKSLSPKEGEKIWVGRIDEVKGCSALGAAWLFMISDWIHSQMRS